MNENFQIAPAEYLETPGLLCLSGRLLFLQIFQLAPESVLTGLEHAFQRDALRG